MIPFFTSSVQLLTSNVRVYVRTGQRLFISDEADQRRGTDGWTFGAGSGLRPAD